MNSPPPKPPRSYSQNDLDIHSVKQQNEYLKESIDNLADTINNHQNHIKQLSITVENLSVKVGTISDIVWKGGCGLIGLLLTLVITYYFKK
jgi:hypothetical protein